MCLTAARTPTDLETITACDLIATYMKHFGLGQHNLHGDSPFVIQEFEARRSRVKAGLALLVRTGLAKSDAAGSFYEATEACRSYADSFTGEYAQQYRQALGAVLNYPDLSMMIRSIAQMEERYV